MLEALHTTDGVWIFQINNPKRLKNERKKWEHTCSSAWSICCFLPRNFQIKSAIRNTVEFVIQCEITSFWELVRVGRFFFGYTTIRYKGYFKNTQSGSFTLCLITTNFGHAIFFYILKNIYILYFLVYCVVFQVYSYTTTPRPTLISTRGFVAC